MGKSGSETVTQERVIPPFLQPFVTRETGVRTRAIERLQGQLAGAGAQHLVEPFTPEQQEAFDVLAARGRGEGGFLPQAEETFLRAARGEVSPVTREAEGVFRDFTARDPLQDPAIREATTAAVRSILPEISSVFARSGRAGSGLERAAIGQATADALTGLLEQERSRRFGAAGALADLGSRAEARRLTAAQALPGLAQVGPSLLLSAGGPVQALRQRELEAPVLAQERLLAAASGTPISSLIGTAQTSPLHSNPAAGALGGGIAGAQLGGVLGSGLGELGLGSLGSALGPIGGIAGAVLGGLLS